MFNLLDLVITRSKPTCQPSVISTLTQESIGEIIQPSFFAFSDHDSRIITQNLHI